MGSLAQECFCSLFSSHYDVVSVIFDIFDLFHLTLSRSFDQNILSRCLQMSLRLYFLSLYLVSALHSPVSWNLFFLSNIEFVCQLKCQVYRKYHASNQDFVSLRSSHPFLEKSFHRISLLWVSDVHRRYDVIGRRQLKKLKKVLSRFMSGFYF